MKRVAIDLHYLPTLEFFAAIHDADELLLFPDDLYPRQSFLNRTKILLANKVETLSIPVQGRRPRIPQNQVKIDYTQKWQNVHLRGIQSAYGKAPFFEYFFPYFELAILRSEEKLWNLDKELLTICLNLLRWPVKLSTGKNLSEEPGILDIKGQIRPGGHFSEREYYTPVAYPQVFGLDFEPNLSILDLLFCMGPEAGNLLKNSAKIP